MPHEDTPLLGAAAPKRPHLGLVIGEAAAPETLAIPPGANMAIIIDPSKPDGVVPLVLIDVSIKSLVFRCGCGQADCTRVVTFKAKWTGFHGRGRPYATR